MLFIKPIVLCHFVHNVFFFFFFQYSNFGCFNLNYVRQTEFCTFEYRFGVPTRSAMLIVYRHCLILKFLLRFQFFCSCTSQSRQESHCSWTEPLFRGAGQKERGSGDENDRNLSLSVNMAIMEVDRPARLSRAWFILNESCCPHGYIF